MTEDTVKKTFRWDGEIIKLDTVVKEREITPKDLIISLDQSKNGIVQMQDQLDKIEQQKTMILHEIEQAKKFIEERKHFEEKAIEIQKKKLDLLIRKNWDACLKKVEERFKDDPAMSVEQKQRMKSAIFQNELAICSDVANKIAPKIYKKYLYEEPVYKCPFKG